MKIKTRRGIFETNSSSCHSLTLDIDNVDFGVDEKLNEDITLGTCEYGWGVETLEGWLAKSDYLSINADDKEKNLITNAIHRKYPNSNVVILDEDDQDYGYIDHQSIGDVWESIRDEATNRNKPLDDMVFEFIFGNSTILISNDNIE